MCLNLTAMIEKFKGTHWSMCWEQLSSSPVKINCLRS